jgi:hypothetical protein
MMSSVTPSLKYCWSGSPDMFVNGSTAIDGLAGRAKASVEGDIVLEGSWRAPDTRYTWIGSFTFLIVRGPTFSNETFSLPLT